MNCVSIIYKLLQTYEKETGFRAEVIYMHPITYHNKLIKDVKLISAYADFHNTNQPIILDTPIILDNECPIDTVYVGEDKRKNEKPIFNLRGANLE